MLCLDQGSSLEVLHTFTLSKADFQKKIKFNPMSDDHDLDRARATIEVHHFFSDTTPQFGKLRPLPKIDLEKNKTATCTG